MMFVAEDMTMVNFDQQLAIAMVSNYYFLFSCSLKENAGGENLYTYKVRIRDLARLFPSPILDRFYKLNRMDIYCAPFLHTKSHRLRFLLSLCCLKQ